MKKESKQQQPLVDPTITYAKIQLKASNYVEPPFKVIYNLEIPKALDLKVNRAYQTFIDDCNEELAEVEKLEYDEYLGSYSKNLRSGQGMMKF